MAEVRKEILIDAPADRVWAITSGIGSVAEWLPTIESARIEGNVRHLTLDQGRGEISERITMQDEEERVVEYEKVGEEGALRVYRARFSAEPEGDATRVVWTADLEAGAGVDEADLTAGIEASYRAGLDNLRRLAEGG